MNINNTFYPHIEGLRGLAVLLVILYHLNNSFFFGYLGVDIFFVISGYVITGSLITSFNSGSKNVLSKFYSKRILRIYPALIFTLIITFIFYLIIGNISNYEIVFKTFIYSVFGLSNIFFLRRNNSYFEDEIDNPLIHTWSLGVEEQFYIVFPIILFFYFKLKSQLIFNKFIKIFFIFIFISSILYFFLETNELLKFWSPIARFWELLTGCILCFAQKKNKEFRVLIVLILIIIFFNILKFQREDLYLSISIIFSSILIVSGKYFLVNFFFSNWIIRWIGKISYSMYLVHYPLLYFFNIYFDIGKVDVITIYFIILFLLSSFSYFAIEKYFTSKNINFFYENNTKRILISFLSILIFSSFVLIKKVNESIDYQKQLISEKNYINKKFYDFKNNSTSYKNYEFLGNNIKDCIYQNFDKEKLKANCFSKNNNKKLLFFIGDSHAASLVMITEKNYDDFDVILAASAGGLYSLNFYKIDHYTVNDKSINISQNYKIFFSDSLKLYNELSNQYETSYLIISSDYLTHINQNIILDSNYTKISDKQEIYQKYANEIVSFSKKLKDNQKIIFIKNLPQPKLSAFDCLKRIIFMNNEKDFCDYDRDYYGHDKVYDSLTQNQSENLILYDFGDLICNKKKCKFFSQDHKFNIIIDDKSHITQESVKLFRNNFFKFIEKN